MFKWFSKQEQEKEEACHHEFKELGNFYKDQRTIYKNESDMVFVFKVLKCKKCDELEERDLLSKMFPVYMTGESRRRDEFIEKLERNGFQNEEDFILKNC